MLSSSISTTSLVSDPGDTRQSVIKRLSTSSVKSLAELLSSSSSSSVQLAEGDVEVVTEDGVRHSDVSLQARHYKTPAFASQLLAALKKLKVPSWAQPEITETDIKVFKVSGSMTNAVFFVSCPSIPDVRTILLRIYGPSSGTLISRPRELHILHILSSIYHIGPKVYGTFANGRIEEYFDSTTLTASDLRDPEISRWIGARMAELHSVDIEVIEETSADNRGEGRGWEIAVKKNVRSWLSPASEVLSLHNVAPEVRADIDLDAFRTEWGTYMRWLSTVDDVEHGSRRVFAHNDTQYGNLLRVKNPQEGLPDHRQIIVVDFEYASPNPASFDIANHFHEWTANYHCTTPHILDRKRYPKREERHNLYRAYLKHAAKGAQMAPADLDAMTESLDDQVRYWSPASHAMWAIWGIVQAREDIESGLEEPEFDYIGYSRCRIASFREELRALGVVPC